MKPWHIVVVLIVIIVVFGAAKLPDIARSLGQSAKVLKKEMRELQDDVPPGGYPAHGQPGQYPAGQYPASQYPVQGQPGSYPAPGQAPQQGQYQSGYPSQPGYPSQSGQPGGVVPPPNGEWQQGQNGSAPHVS